MALMSHYYRVIFGMFLAAAAALAQGIRNSDVTFMLGAARTPAYVVAGASISVAQFTGFTEQFVYGYQFWQAAGGSVWLDIPITFGFPGTPTTSVPSSSSNSSMTIAPGLRFMAPFSERLSGYAVAGGGIGRYNYSPVLESRLGFRTTTHGLFDIGAGLDFRLTRRISIRGEIRDFVTGRGLSGIPGRNHIVIPFGVTLHY